MLKWVQQQRAEADSREERERKEDGKRKKNNTCGAKDKALSVRSHPRSLSLALSLLATATS
jgi:hypothetical protein